MNRKYSYTPMHHACFISNPYPDKGSCCNALYGLKRTKNVQYINEKWCIIVSRRGPAPTVSRKALKVVVSKI